MSQEIQEAVYKQQEVIKDKQLRVQQDLDQVEPAVIEAQNGTVVYLLTSVLTLGRWLCLILNSRTVKVYYTLLYRVIIDYYFFF